MRNQVFADQVKLERFANYRNSGGYACLFGCHVRSLPAAEDFYFLILYEEPPNGAKNKEKQLSFVCDEGIKSIPFTTSANRLSISDFIALFPSVKIFFKYESFKTFGDYYGTSLKECGVSDTDVKIGSLSALENLLEQALNDSFIQNERSLRDE